MNESEIDDLLDAQPDRLLHDDLDDPEERGRLAEVFADEAELEEALVGRRIERVEMVDGGAELVLGFDDGTAVSVIARAATGVGPVEAAVLVIPDAPGE